MFLYSSCDPSVNCLKMSEGTGETPGEFLYSDTNYQQKWREEAKARLLQRAKIRKEVLNV